MTLTPTDKPLRRTHRAALERILREHLARIADPRLTTVVTHVLRLHRQEAALWRTRYRELARTHTESERDA